MNGKGDKQRKSQAPDKHVRDEWERLFSTSKKCQDKFQEGMDTLERAEKRMGIYFNER